MDGRTFFAVVICSVTLQQSPEEELGFKLGSSERRVGIGMQVLFVLGGESQFRALLSIQIFSLAADKRHFSILSLFPWLFISRQLALASSSLSEETDPETAEVLL